jgi:hypothetical protein
VLGGLGFGGGLTFIAVGSYGETQGPISVIIIIDDTITNPIIVIHPAEPLLLNEVNPGMRRARIERFVTSVGNLVPPRIVSLGQGMRTEYPR